MNTLKTPERIDPLRRIFIPVEDIHGVFRTHDGITYRRGRVSGVIRRTTPKVRGKAARRADKLERRLKQKAHGDTHHDAGSSQRE